MSTAYVEAVQVNEVRPHPNADRLEVAVVKGATVVVGKGTFETGEVAAYFPPDTLIPDDLAAKLGVTKYLKHAVYTEGEGSSQCRVAGFRLRGQPSFGFLTKLNDLPLANLLQVELGQNLSGELGAKKYQPPVRINGCSEASAEYPLFHRYCEIENYYRYPDVIPEGTPVRITEKIHGTNSRVGMVLDGNQFVEMAGSHRVRRKKPVDGTTCMYWEPLSYEPVRKMLQNLQLVASQSVILFGEIYGPRIQDMDYGIATGRGYRLFDISIDGQYADWFAVKDQCAHFGVETVPELYVGRWSKDLIEKYTDGPTTLGSPMCSFKGREGIVITPLKETFSATLNGRLILKSVSADYLGRKDAEDND